MHIELENLPRSLQSALAAHGYRKKDIEVEGSETFCVQDAGGQGRRGFCTVVNIDTGVRETTHGSWGGANMFNPQNAVDLDDSYKPIPDGFAVIKGSSGNYLTARILVNPSNLTKLIPDSNEDELSELEKKALRVFRLRGGYRKDEASREGLVYSAKNPLFAGLIASGHIKANKAGAMSITTKGKNTPWY